MKKYAIAIVLLFSCGRQHAEERLGDDAVCQGRDGTYHCVKDGEAYICVSQIQGGCGDVQCAKISNPTPGAWR